MSDINHTHIDNDVVDADKHFTINTTTRVIVPDASNKKLTLMQYDNKSERYSFSIDRRIEGHDVMNCNRVTIHFINIGSNRQQNARTYSVDDMKPDTEDDNKVVFTWLISEEATQYNGVLSFLVTFECVEGDVVKYRWSSLIFNQIQIAAGMNNHNEVLELYSDDLLIWQNKMEIELIPILVDQCYIDRNFATSEEVGEIFSVSDPDTSPTVVIVSYQEVTDTSIDALFNE